MADQIIKQPDGKYAVFSSVIDGFVLLDATPDEIIAERIRVDSARIEADLRKVFKQLDEGGKPYHQFTLTWDEAKQEHESRFGKLAASPKGEVR